MTKFVTLFLARYRDDSHGLTYCNAGHNPPLLQRGDGALEPLLPTGAAIGLIDQSEFRQTDISLQAGNRLFMYTDGVVESMNERKELFGEERLIHLLRASVHLAPALLISSVRDSLQQFSLSKSPADDTTIIVMDVKE